MQELSLEDESASPPLLLWVFTEDLNFSSSIDADSRTDPTRAMKILWKSITNPSDAEAHRTQMAVEQVTLPANVYNAVATALRESAEILPESSRSFNGWNVGLLERFS